MKLFDLKIENIINLELKLDGKLPIDRDELLALANSWGRYESFYTTDKNSKEIIVDICKSNKCYDLSKLDVSKITNFNKIFNYSNFDGDINSWDVSKVTTMFGMFYGTKEFNSPLDKWNVSNNKDMKSMFCYTEKFNQDISMWDTSNVINMSYMFFKSKKFNQNINSWNISKVTNINSMFEGSKAFSQPILWDILHINGCNDIFLEAKAFEKIFNKGKELPRDRNEIKEWLIENRDKMIALDIEVSKGKELDNFLFNLNNENIIINKILKE